MCQTFNVSAKSDTMRLAKAIRAAVRTDHEVVAVAIGAGAVNQTVKAVAVTDDLIIQPELFDIDQQGETCTVMRMLIKPEL